MNRFKYSPPQLINQKSEKSMGYRLRLANGLEWNLLGTEEVSPWLQELAKILQLRTHELNGSNKIIFSRAEAESLDPVLGLEPNLKKALPETGWQVQDVKSLRFWHHPEVGDVICELGEDESHDLSVIRMWQALAPIYHKVQEEGGVSFHCGLVAKDGKGVLLAAPGNTGKSTCCRRIPPPWKSMSDDEVLIVLDKNNNYMVHPFPTWSNLIWKREKTSNSWDTGQAVPLKAIFFLEQSEADEVEIVGQGQAAIFINESAGQLSRRTWRKLGPEMEKQMRGKLFSNACEMAKKIPAYILRVSLTGKFWEKIEEVL